MLPTDLDMVPTYLYMDPTYLHLLPTDLHMVPTDQHLLPTYIGMLPTNSRLEVDHLLAHSDWATTYVILDQNNTSNLFCINMISWN